MTAPPKLPADLAGTLGRLRTQLDAYPATISAIDVGQPAYRDYTPEAVGRMKAEKQAEFVKDAVERLKVARTHAESAKRKANARVDEVRAAHRPDYSEIVVRASEYRTELALRGSTAFGGKDALAVAAEFRAQLRAAGDVTGLMALRQAAADDIIAATGDGSSRDLDKRRRASQLKETFDNDLVDLTPGLREALAAQAETSALEHAVYSAARDAARTLDRAEYSRAMHEHREPLIVATAYGDQHGGAHIFDPTAAAAGGGGVVWPAGTWGAPPAADGK